MNDNVPEVTSARIYNHFADITGNSRFLLLQDQSQGTEHLLCAFAGRSMLPTLVAGDLLELVDYGSQPVKIGDIICFRTPEFNSLIVHRVRKVDTDSLRTRGDNNALDDEWRVRPSAIVGRVVAYRRGEQRFEIQRGIIGILHMQWRRLIRRITGRLKRVMFRRLPLGAPALLLVRLLPAKLKPRVVVFNKRTRLFMANRCIGEFNVNRKRWHIPGWHRFLIDTAKLPSQSGITFVNHTSGKPACSVSDKALNLRSTPMDSCRE